MRSRLLLLGSLLWLLQGCCPDDEGGAFAEGSQVIIVVNPDPVVFSTVNVGATERLTVTINNSLDSTGVLDMTSVRLENATADLSITQPLQTVLQPGESTTMEVVYSPSDGVPDNGQLLITYKGTSEPRVVDIQTVAQQGGLVFFPQQVNFGEVVSGTPTAVPVRGVNNGSFDLELGPTIIDSDSPDFKLSDLYRPTGKECTGAEGAEVIEQPFVLAPDESYCVDVIYTPFGGGQDTGQLQALRPFDPDNPTGVDIVEVANILGTEVGPEIEIKPEPKLNFGGVEVGGSQTLTFQIFNVGNKELSVFDVIKGDQESDAFADVTVLTEVPEGTIVEPGGAPFEVEVQFAPTMSYAQSFGALGFIEVLSDDGDEPTSFVSVFAQVASPKLQVTPSELVDFGLVASAKKADRKITFTNTGTVDAHVTNFAISVNTADSEFSIKSALPAEGITIAPNDYYVVTLTFQNIGGQPGDEVFGEVQFDSDDPEAANMATLKATRTDKAECKLLLNPVAINYGTVPYEKTKTLAMNIINVGSSPCSWSHATVHDGAGEFIPGFGGCTAGPVSNSKHFKVVKQPPAIKDLIKPGDSFPIEIQYAPEANIFSGSGLDEFIVHKGVVQLHVLDFAQADAQGTPKEIVYPPIKDPQTMAVDCNLTAKTGVAQLAAIPGEIEFDLTTVGCHSKTQTVTIYNLGTAPLNICDVYLDGCSPEFKLKKVPGIPACESGGLVLNGNQSFEVEVVYAPQDTSEDWCSLAVDEADVEKSVAVPLYGAGTYDTDQTDVFTQLAGQKVDVLFVVDNSGSMGDEQKNLSNNFSAFTSTAGQWDTDFQIGVVTTDIEENNPRAAELNPKGSATDPRFVTSSNGNVSSFANMVKVGDNGSGTEQGLEAARRALSAPLISFQKPIKECTKDADCTAPAVCVPSMVTSGKSYCGGWNLEFLREDATLEIVFVSDEEDSSSADLNFYVDFFKSIKGFANENLFHAHAIVGGPGGCDGAGGSAADGARYRHVAAETGGKFHSICDTNWAQKLEDIGDVAFGLKVQFFLSRPAVPETIEVTVGGQMCTAGWTYDAEANAILFDPNHPCMPQEGEEIQVYYEVICYDK